MVGEVVDVCARTRREVRRLLVATGSLSVGQIADAKKKGRLV